ncbi:hypothetical protein ACFL2L_01235 [Patescibacteria group bacterium]
MGYRYNFKKNKFEKTGLLFLKTKQSDINININDELYKNKVKKYSFIPKFISSKIEYTNELKISLLPGEYDLKIYKESYWDWKKMIEIKPNLTTFATEIKLFKKTLPIKIIDGNNSKIMGSPKQNTETIYMTNSNKATSSLMSYIIDSKKINTIHAFLESSKNNFNLSPKGSKILISENNSNYIINTDKEKEQIYLNDIGKNLVNIKWDMDNDYILYGIGKNNHIIYKIDLIKQKKEPLAMAKCDDYIIQKNKLYIIENNEKNKTTILKLSINEENVDIAIFPYTENLNFIENTGEFLMLKDSNASVTYIIDPLAPFLNKIKATINGIQKYRWNDEKNKLLYMNDFEIWIYDLNENKNRLITRLSDKIKNVIWHKNENFIIFNTSSSINILETSNEGNKNQIELLSTKNIDSILIDKKGETLYFNGEIGVQTGLFSLDLY